jgi:hypothetical protein
MLSWKLPNFYKHFGQTTKLNKRQMYHIILYFYLCYQHLHFIHLLTTCEKAPFGDEMNEVIMLKLRSNSILQKKNGHHHPMGERKNIGKNSDRVFVLFAQIFLNSFLNSRKFYWKRYSAFQGKENQLRYWPKILDVHDTWKMQFEAEKKIIL